MIPVTGNITLALAVLASAGAVLSAIAAVRFQSPGHLSWARWLIGLTFAALTVSSIALFAAFVGNDFRFTYVAAYSDRAMPVGYRMAAFWAGQEGSLLLWAWLLLLLCVAAVIGYRRINADFMAIAHAAMAAVCCVFACFVLFAANPFTMFDGPAPVDGRGMNPMLQDPAMLAHPPLLFLGYAAYTIPFAVLVGVLVMGRDDNQWLSLIRRWVILSWVFLGAGIIVGGWWAYIELGWGGYWAWDPVENASLLPWLTGTALMHSIMVQQRRGMFKFWNAHLIWVTFVLCIFGTYLTRSGVVASVHTFAPSALASCFLIFLASCSAISLALISWRRRMLRPEAELRSLISRDGAFLCGNVLLVFMTLITLIGTIFPVLSGLFMDDPATAKPEFYNTTVAPMIVLLVGIMAIGPVLVPGNDSARRIGRNLVLPGIMAIITAAIVFAGGVHNFWALLVAAIAALGTFTVIIGFARAVSARKANTAESWAAAAMRLIDLDHRRYGGQLAHLGVMIMVIGVAGSSLYNTEEIHRLKPGETAAAGRYTITYLGLKEVPGRNFMAVQADVRLANANGETRILTPQRRFYTNWEEKPQSQVAIRSSWREDVYLILAGWEESGALTAIQVKVNPLVLWLWIGSIVMGVGAIFCTLPHLLPVARRVVVPRLPEPGAAIQPTALTPAAAARIETEQPA
jgi:cytochrome c-type biogenesis protein CcmF